MREFKEFKKHLTLNGLSNRTIELYCTNINIMFRDYIKDKELTQENLNNFLLKIKEKYTPGTWNTYVSAIKSYLDFINSDLKVPKRAKKEKKIPYYITKEYFEEEVIKTAECVFKNPLRNKALLRFMFETGVRREDIMFTKRNNFELNKNRAKIYVPKNRKERIVYFTNKTKDTLKGFFDLTPEEENAFNIPSKATINYIFKKLQEWLSNDKIHPHCFRHSYATHLRKNGAGLETIMELMGLDSYQTVLRYAHISQENMQKEYNKYFK